MDFRQLEVFCATAEELHFGRAARRLFIAQASVSEQIRRLESELGTVLLHRSSRSVRLTPAGGVLLTEARELLARRERVVQLVRAAGAGRRGALRMAANYPASRMLLLPLLERMAAVVPDVTIVPRELSSTDQIRELERGELDLGLAYGPIDRADLGSEHLLDVPVVAVVRASHPLAAAGSIPLRDLPALRYITTHAGATSRIEDALVDAALHAGVRIRPRPSTTDLSGYLLELETTDTIGFSSLPRGEQSAGQGMRMLRLAPEPSVAIHAVWRADGDEPLVNTSLDELRGLARLRREQR
ncbi:LysR family transcriptional regulator [Microbacterium sp. X-17]|uniref:LysR family transcriptional regulator n=1 Tax=Microbacterium sp. X-17 TaxID=3144404 RepID=UPI0031F4CD55